MARQIPNRAATVLIPLLLAAAIVGWSVHLGPDASWDLRNYHLYDPFAAFHKRGFLDLVPAQRQTFHPPMLDLPTLWLRFRLNHWPRLLDGLLAVPSAVAVGLAWAIGRQIEPGSRAPALASLALAVLFGATGAAGLPTTGSSMSEMPAACFALAGLWLLLRGVPRGAPAWLPLLAGVGFGAALALKLTLAILALAALVAQLLAGSGRRRLLGVVGLGGGIAVGAALVGGPWWWHLDRLTGSPIFPYANDLFRAPLYPPTGLADTRFLPRTPMQSLFYPFFWSVSPSELAGELPVRDPRLALAFVALLSCPLVAILRTRLTPEDRRVPVLLLFLAGSYGLWELGFGILRYLAPVELLSGLVLLVALRPLARLSVWLPPALLGVALLGCAAVTVYPDWGRAAPGPYAAAVALPALPADAMVLLLTPDPMAYVAAFAAPTVRFVGVDNNLVQPGQDSMLAHRIEQAVRGQRGPLYGLEVPSAPDRAAGVLGFYRLHRALPCAPVRTSLESDGLRLCRLVP